MENLPLLFNQTHILERQKEIRQDVQRARLSSKTLSDQATKIISSVDAFFGTAMNPLKKRETQSKEKRYTN